MRPMRLRTELQDHGILHCLAGILMRRLGMNAWEYPALCTWSNLGGDIEREVEQLKLGPRLGTSDVSCAVSGQTRLLET